MTVIAQMFYALNQALLRFFVILIFRSKEVKELNEILTENTKILLAEQQNELLNHYLLKQKYLNVICLQKDISNSGRHHNTFEFSTNKQVEQNNADVMFLSGKSIKTIRSFRYYRHTSQILLEIPHFISILTIIPGFYKNMNLKRIHFAGRVNLVIGLHKKTYLVFNILKRKKIATRKYISPLIGIEHFFKQLKENSIQYAVLRWFEELPQVDKDEDIDILVSDKDAFRLAELLDERIGTIPIDTYTVTGIPGFDFKQMSYLTPSFAKKILETSVEWNKLYQVPNQEMHFSSMAYHALYHKGKKSGLPSIYFNEKYQDSEHDYEMILTKLAMMYGIPVQINMESLHEWMERKGYSPPLDTLYRLTFDNEWIKKLIDNSKENPIINKNVTVFILREEAANQKLEERIISEIENEGFTIIKDYVFSLQEKEYFSQSTRGGNWSKGPYPKSGGKASRMIVTTDLLPTLPNFNTKLKYPGLQNQRVTCKNRIRDSINSVLEKDNRCNLLHSSDNDVEAWYYLNLIFNEEKIQQIIEKIEKFSKEFHTREKVIRTLSENGRRAKVELIEWNKQKVIKKTFKPQSLRFMEREKNAINLLKEKFPETPKILECGDNYIIYPYYQDKLKWKRGMFKFISIKRAKMVVRFLERLYQEGYAFIDFHPMNVLYDKEHGLKVIDYEFFYIYSVKPSKFELSYDIAGIPTDFQEDAPLQREYGYDFNLLPYIGVDVISLMNNSSFNLRKKRIKYFFSDKLTFSFRHKIVNYIRSRKWHIQRDTKIFRNILRLSHSNIVRNKISQL